MKNDRQTILLEIIEQEAVETQEQLLQPGWRSGA